MNPVIRYAFAALLLLGSTQSHAGYGWGIGSSPNYTPSSYPYLSPSSACNDNGFNEPYHYKPWTASFESNTSYICINNAGYNTGIRAKANNNYQNCPAGEQDDPTGYFCVEATEPPIVCEAGSDVFTARWSMDQLNTEGFQPHVIDANGCLYDNTSVVQCGVYADGVTACLYEYTQTDNSTEGATLPQPEEYTDNTSVKQSSSDDTGATTFVKDPPITNPDGSTVQTTQETTVNTSGSGAAIWNDDSHFYIRDSTGTTTIYDRQKTVISNTDGTIDEVVVVSKSNQTPQTDTTIVNKNTGNTSTVNNNQSTTTNKTTTTNNYYDSDGNLTDSTSTTEGGTETEGDENEEGNCGAPNQPACEVKLNGEDQLKDPSLVLEQSGIISGIDGYIDEIGEIGDEDVSAKILENPFSLPSTGTCNPANYNIQYQGVTLNFFDKFCEAYDSTLHPILQFFFYMFTAMTLYFIFLSATQRTQ